MRVPDTAKALLTVVAGIAGVVALSIAGLAIVNPEVVSQSSLGAEFFLADLAHTGEGLQSVTGFRPLADGLLLVGAYVLVSLIGWSQTRFASYLKARGHGR